jgi:hypothetical protein
MLIVRGTGVRICLAHPALNMSACFPTSHDREAPTFSCLMMPEFFYNNRCLERLQEPDRNGAGPLANQRRLHDQPATSAFVLRT